MANHLWEARTLDNSLLLQMPFSPHSHRHRVTGAQGNTQACVALHLTFCFSGKSHWAEEKRWPWKLSEAGSPLLLNLCFASKQMWGVAQWPLWNVCGLVSVPNNGLSAEARTLFTVDAPLMSVKLFVSPFLLSGFALLILSCSHCPPSPKGQCPRIWVT